MDILQFKQQLIRRIQNCLGKRLPVSGRANKVSTSFAIAQGRSERFVLVDGRWKHNKHERTITPKKNYSNLQT